ncbi:MAG: MarR family transcriptional regulator [Demequina sp.]|uniref:MarR family transcriptional regulator n=1 Tax=Demequina sp. TaxID=2050685 RepID=UPI003A84745E
MDDENTPALSSRAPLLEAVRLLQTQMRDAAAAVAPDPISFMTLYQAFLFQHIARAPGGLPLATLVERLQTSAAAVSQMVDRMARKGLVDVEQHPRDGRCKLVIPTDRGYRDYDWAIGAATRHDQRWRLAAARSADEAPGIDDYVASGMALWRWERRSVPMP